MPGMVTLGVLPVIPSALIGVVMMLMLGHPGSQSQCPLGWQQRLHGLIPSTSLHGCPPASRLGEARTVPVGVRV